jgi:hypothetical protein
MAIPFYGGETGLSDAPVAGEEPEKEDDRGDDEKDDTDPDKEVQGLYESAGEQEDERDNRDDNDENVHCSISSDRGQRVAGTVSVMPNCMTGASKQLVQ